MSTGLSNDILEKKKINTFQLVFKTNQQSELSKAKNYFASELSFLPQLIMLQIF